MEFLRCPANCRYKQPVTTISTKDLDGLSMPHLEDVAEDNYTQLNNDNWSSDTHFIHWVEHSDDLVVHYINACTIPEEDPATVANFGTNDTAY
jgi:hypothetical protein